MSNRPRIRLLQLPVPTLVPEEATGNISMGAGTLVAHWRASLQADLADVEVLDGLQVARLGDAALLAWITSQQPQAVGFTVTVWNAERTLGLCARLRETLPQCHIWLGGPEVAADTWFVQEEADERALFDVAVEGEGEGPFHDLIMDLVESPVRSNQPGRFVAARPPDSAASLALRNPFQAGILQPDVDGTVWVEFSRGCPYRCSFCRYHGGRGHHVVRAGVDEIASFFRWARAADVRQVYVLDPSLDAYPDLDGLLACIARENPPPRIPLFVELRAEEVDDRRALLLFKAGVARVECGLQTLTPLAMKLMGRQVDWQRFSQGAGRLRDAGIDLRVDLMLGLPGDTPEQMKQAFQKLHEAQLADCAQPFMTQVLPGTRLRKMAETWQIEHLSRPPYLVLSTPLWSLAHLSGGLGWAGDQLGVNVAPDNEPVVHVPDWVGPNWGEKACADPSNADAEACDGIALGDPGWEQHTFSYSTHGAVAQYSWNLCTRRGRQALASQTFERVGTPCCIWLTMTLQQQKVAIEALLRLRDQEPHLPLTLMLDVPPDDVLFVSEGMGAFVRTSRSYLEYVYDSTNEPHLTGVRLHPVLPVAAAAEVPRETLERLRQLGRVVWRVDVSRLSQVPSAVGRCLVPPRDLLLVSVEERGELPDGLLQKLYAESYFADQVIWDHPLRQGRWTAFLARVRGDVLA